MRRVDRRRTERLRRTLSVVGLSFALGALADIALTWRLHEFEDAAASTESLSVASPSVPRIPEPVVSARSVEPSERVAIGTRGIAGHEEAAALLRKRHLEFPVEGVERGDLKDTFFEARSGHAHEAIDIMAPRHTAVRAVEDGAIAKLFTSAAGGLTIYQFEPSGTFCYYYAHLDHYASGLREGQAVRRGDIIGYVGSTGNASKDAPHLHFAIFRLNAEKQWWKGDPVNPYPVFR